MKIHLIQPSIGKKDGKGYVKSWQMQPLPIATLAGLTPKEHEVTFTDDRFETINYEIEADLIAMPVETYTAQRSYKIARKFRERNMPVVMGGIHAMLEPQEVAQHCDVVCISGAENVWEGILDHFSNGNNKNGLVAKVFSQQSGKRERLSHVEPRRDLFEGKPYLPLEIVETGRGCPFTCDFCAVYGAYNQSYRSKSIEDIVSDVESLNRKNVYFADDNFVSDFRRTKELCRALEPLNIHWFSHGSINMANDEDLLKSLERSGCTNILIGFESLNPESLKAMGKSWNIAKRSYSDAVKKLRDNGLTIYATFALGYDTDTKDDFQRTVDFAIEQKFALAAFNHLIPYPNTPLYKRLNQEGRLFEDKWWLREGYKFGEVVFQPKNMSAEELAEGCFDCRKQFYSYSSIARRMLDFKANAKNPYTALVASMANLTSRKGIVQRQYWEIGSGE